MTSNLDALATAELRRQLQGLPMALCYAWGALRPSTQQPTGARVSGGMRTPPLPVSLDVLTLLGPGSLTAVEDNADWPAPTVLRAWAERTAYESDRPRTDRTLGGHIAYLRDQFEWTTMQLWAVDYAASIGDLWVRLQRYQPVIKLIRHAYVLPCPTCHRLTLAEVEGAPNITCVNRDCNTVLTEHEYNSLATVAAAAIGAAA